MQLPPRFVADELALLLPVWLGADAQDLTMIYCTGKGVAWHDGMTLIQSRIGLPIRLAEDGLSLDKRGRSAARLDSGLAILWHLSRQVNA